jgi:acyl-[acyl carrier protein]--UDP-N-acetylglucosamine O-acyltransferase
MKGNMKRTINIDKLTRHDLDSERLQEIAAILIRTLYARSEEDLSETMEKPHSSDESIASDRQRRDSLKAIHQLLTALPKRGEKWRHRLA